jgi:hypothetical protein
LFAVWSHRLDKSEEPWDKRWITLVIRSKHLSGQ